MISQPQVAILGVGTVEKRVVVVDDMIVIRPICYLTPRVLIDAIVDCVRPQPGEVVADPACGTGGFLLAAHDYVKNHFELDRDQKRHLRFEALRGTELVPNVARLCGMNLYLHGVGPYGAAVHSGPNFTRRHSKRTGLRSRRVNRSIGFRHWNE